MNFYLKLYLNFYIRYNNWDSNKSYQQFHLHQNNLHLHYWGYLYEFVKKEKHTFIETNIYIYISFIKIILIIYFYLVFL